MKPSENLNKIVPAVWIAGSAFFGIAATEHHNEAIRAETAATILEIQGHPQAAERRDYAEQQEDKRNRKLLALSAYVTVAAVSRVAFSQARSEKP